MLNMPPSQTLLSRRNPSHQEALQHNHALNIQPDVRLPPHPALHEPMPPDYAASFVSTHGEGIAAPR
jgi:hypothetical protein